MFKADVKDVISKVFVSHENRKRLLTRSINTSLTTSLPLVAIFLFGGETLKFFALALIIGFASGAYSSIFIASTLWAWWRDRRPGNRGTKVAIENPSVN